jgi:hypothetical protein
MRSYIFTRRERELLERWLEMGEESQTTRNLFTSIRTNFPQLADDVQLLIRVIRRLQRHRRWHGRVRKSDRLLTLLHSAKKSLKRARKAVKAAR